jgi:hypothetical protein
MRGALFSEPRQARPVAAMRRWSQAPRRAGTIAAPARYPAPSRLRRDAASRPDRKSRRVQEPPAALPASAPRRRRSRAAARSPFAMNSLPRLTNISSSPLSSRTVGRLSGGGAGWGAVVCAGTGVPAIALTDAAGKGTGATTAGAAGNGVIAAALRRTFVVAASSVCGAATVGRSTSTSTRWVRLLEMAGVETSAGMIPTVFSMP